MDGDRKAIRHSVQPIEWWPGQWRSVVTVPAGMVSRANSSLTPRVSTLRSWDLCPDHLRSEYGDEVFSRAVAAGDGVAFYFEPPIPLAEGATFAQVLVDTVRYQEAYSWPDVMLDSRLIGDIIKADSSTSNRVPITRGRWLDGDTLQTWTTVQIYASAAQPPDELLETDRPVPTVVKGDYFGHPIGPLFCLHPPVVLESRASTDAEIANLTPTVSLPGEGNKMSFGATNHGRWLDHISDITLQQDGGLYKRTVITREAPFTPPLTYV